MHGRGLIHLSARKGRFLEGAPFIASVQDFKTADQLEIPPTPGLEVRDFGQGERRTRIVEAVEIKEY